jgi:hypothetical protein
MGKVFKSITKPVAKVLDKIVPNEIKPALPFVAAALPFLAPGLGAGIGKFFVGAGNPLLARAIGSGAINLISQASQEGAAERGISPVSLGIASLTGALASPGTPGEMTAAEQLRGLKTIGEVGLETGQNLSTLDTLKNLGLEGTAAASEYLSKGVLGPTTPLTGSQLLTTGKSLVPGQLAASGELAYNAALDANKKYMDELTALGQTASSNRQRQIDYIRSAMMSAGFTEDEIQSAITRSGFADGGSTTKQSPMPINPEMLALAIFGKRLDELTSTQKNALSDYIDVPKKAKGGIMDLGGNEMDLRAAGGFVPIGKKERADDVPARLSKNEFVMTAKAVRAAGGGDIKKGAKRMYKIMNQLEAMA